MKKMNESRMASYEDRLGQLRDLRQAKDLMESTFAQLGHYVNDLSTQGHPAALLAFVASLCQCTVEPRYECTR